MNSNNSNPGWLTAKPPTTWTRYETKRFEVALVMFPEELGMERWQMIANQVPGKTVEDVMAHYAALCHDVNDIESGRVPLPSYLDDDDDLFSEPDSASSSQISFGPSILHKPKTGEPERKKGTPWTEEEHRLFLLGLEKYGKGDWRSISRNVVVTRTPTQVASHAQKYFLRQAAGIKKERKRSSIHDITTTADTNIVPPPTHSYNHVGYENYNFPMQ